MSYQKMMKWNSRHRKGISYKNGYMGFNPAGHTSESLDAKAAAIRQEFEGMSEEQRQELYNNFKEIESWRETKNIYCSNSMEHNIFMSSYRTKYK